MKNFFLVSFFLSVITLSIHNLSFANNYEEMAYIAAQDFGITQDNVNYIYKEIISNDQDMIMSILSQYLKMSQCDKASYWEHNINIDKTTQTELLAIKQYNGDCIQQDVQSSIYNMKQCAKENIYCKRNLMLMLLADEYKNKEEYSLLVKEMADYGFPEAMYILTQLYLGNGGVIPSNEEAYFWCLLGISRTNDKYSRNSLIGVKTALETIISDLATKRIAQKANKWKPQKLPKKLQNSNPLVTNYYGLKPLN